MSFIVKFIQLYSSAETVKKATVVHRYLPSFITDKFSNFYGQDAEEEKSEKEGLCPRLGKPSQVYLACFSDKNHYKYKF